MLATRLGLSHLTLWIDSRARAIRRALSARLFWGLLSLLASGCLPLTNADLPTPLPPEYLSTVVALTVEAGKQPPSESGLTAQTPAIAFPPAETPTITVALGTPTPTPTEVTFDNSTPVFEATPTPDSLLFTETPTPTPEIPNAEIEIRNLGPLSKVTSPLYLYAYLPTGAGGKVRVEIYGEDNRLLARQIRVISFVPVGARAVFTTDIDFEISAAAETARLKISIDDEYGRTVALNSVPLILLSIGEADIIPPLDVLAPIIIQEPRKKKLIQGGTVLVSGLARPESDQPLMVRLITKDGREVGMRLAGVNVPENSRYGTFTVEVPYQVDRLTEVLLIVTEGASAINDVTHLTSREILLSP